MGKEGKRLYMPMGTGGLIRYPEEEKEVIKLKPKQIVGIVIVIAVIEIFLKFFF